MARFPASSIHSLTHDLFVQPTYNSQIRQGLLISFEYIMGSYYLYQHLTVTTNLVGEYKISSALRIRKHHNIHVILAITANKNKYVPLAT